MTHQVNYQTYSTFLLRIPGLSLENRKLVPDRESQLESFVRKQWTDPIIRGALELASPALAQELRISLSKDQSVPKSVQYSFLNYFSRFFSRSTPFGLFAGVVSGRIATARVSDFSIFPLPESSLQVRIDNEYLVSKLSDWSTIQEVFDSCLFLPNTSLYRLADQYRYIFASRGVNGGVRYQIESVSWTSYLESVLVFCREGKSAEQLVDSLVDQGYSRDEGESFIRDLVGAQVLVSNLEPVLSGMEYAKYLETHLSALKHLPDSVAEWMRNIKTLHKAVAPSDLESVIRKCEQADRGSGKEVDSGYLLQGDLLRSCSRNVLSHQVANRALLGIRILKALRETPREDPLSEFKDHFRRRFQNRRVPILEVMDQEYGIGLGGPLGQQLADPCSLLDDLPGFGRTGKEQISGSGRALGDLPGWESGSAWYLELSDEDIRSVRNQEGDWPKQLYTLVSLLGTDSEPTLYMPMAAAGNPVYLIARFGFLPDPGIQKMIGDLILDEVHDHPDEMLADVIHLPENRTGNILQRPSCYPYEIPLLSQSLKPAQNQILLADILVTVELDEVILYHQPSGLKIRPRLSNAHNYSQGQLPVYKFLIECGRQKESAVYSLARQNGPRLGFVPGLRYQDLIFRLPEWRLSVEDVMEKVQSKPEDLAEVLRSWAYSAGSPHEVWLSNGDRPFYVDWRKDPLVLSVWPVLKAKKIARFEWFPFSSGTPVKENKYSLANQLVLCYHQKK